MLSAVSCAVWKEFLRLSNNFVFRYRVLNRLNYTSVFIGNDIDLTISIVHCAAVYVKMQRLEKISCF